MGYLQLLQPKVTYFIYNGCVKVIKAALNQVKAVSEGGVTEEEVKRAK